MKEDQNLANSSLMDLFGSVRRSLNFPRSDEPSASVAERIGSCIRKSRVGLGLGFLPKSPSRRLTMGIGSVKEEEPNRIRWRKGEMIGAGAFGQVFMGMNLDSGELLAVKQVVIESSSASKEKAQAHIRELEEEVKLLKNLSHPNIVRYLGIVRDENTLNILLEFVPGGSISSLLSKFGSFPETVIRMYTKQILQGLEYLHRNKIIHRDIKGANILVDNKGCIKLADFGASKQVAQLATMAAAKSFKGTAYWMAPEVIVQSGYSFSADIWSVGCTVIEMATGKPPWSGQYQEVAALFHVGTTKSHPPIPDHLSAEAKDFLLKCLQEDACLRPSSFDLLQHPFVTGKLKVAQPLSCGSKESASDIITTTTQINFGTVSHSDRPMWEAGTDDEMCRLDDEEFPVIGSSFNPVSSFDEFSFTREAACEDDFELTENTIRAFLDEKAVDLKKLQTPLYEEFFNSSNPNSCSSSSNYTKENHPSARAPPTDPKLPPASPGRALFRSGSSRAPSPTDPKLPPASPGPSLFRSGSSRRISHGIGPALSPNRLGLGSALSPNPTGPGSSPNPTGAGSSRHGVGSALSPNPAGPAGGWSRRISHGVGIGGRVLQELGQNVAVQPDLHEVWKEELFQELDEQREKLGLVTPGRATSPNDSPLNRKRNRLNNNNNNNNNIV